MKYSENNKPVVCMMTQSTCYRGTYKFAPKGVLWHCTGANNPNIWRYVQPSDNDANRATLLQKIGKNNYGSDWNHTQVSAGVNAWIGKMADGSVAAVQTLPWDYAPWGCGGAANGTHIQFEMCEDGLTDSVYFEKCYREGVELTAYLCKMYGIDPKGYITLSGRKVPTILCHYDAYNLGVGTGHYDVYNWFNRFGKTMDDVRDDVAALLKGTAASTPVSNQKTEASGEMYRIRKSWKDAKSQIGAYRNLEGAKAACPAGYSVFDSKGNAVYTAGSASTQKSSGAAGSVFTVRVSIDDLNIRSGPGTEFKINSVIKPGVYTIVETQGDWGRLKSGAGWIHLGYTTKL